MKRRRQPYGPHASTVKRLLAMGPVVDAGTRDEVSTYAKGAVANAINMGRLAPASGQKCVQCGGEADRYDHRDYRQPLDVRPVCRSCNASLGPALPLPQGGTYKSNGCRWGGIGGGDGYDPVDWFPGHVLTEVPEELTSIYDDLDEIRFPGGRDTDPDIHIMRQVYWEMAQERRKNGTNAA